MKKLTSLGFIVLSIGIALIYNGFKPANDLPFRKSESRPAGYPDLVNRVATGDNWKSIEAASIRDLIDSRCFKSGTDSLDACWSERGPANIPGRITDMKIDYQARLIYCLSDHGLVFKGNLDGTGWKSLNDQHPLAQGVACYLDILKMPGHNRILVAGWQKTLDGWGVFYSDDEGATWQKPGGLFQYPVSGIRRGKSTGDAVYLFVQEYHAQKSTDYYTIYKSTDQGTAFSVLYRSKIRTGDGNRNILSDMWMSSQQVSNDIYLALEDSLFVVNAQDGSRVFKSKISGIPSENGILLTGASNSNPIRLRAWVGDAGIARYYASDDGGVTWNHKGDYTDGVAAYPFGYNSFSASPFTADTLYFGGILTIRSTDAGASWKLVDMDPTNSYALYHGDVPKTLMSMNPAGETDVYFGTDGGMYKRDAVHDHWVTMSIPGLNSTQIYKMVSKHNEPGKMFVGTQDNGYVKTLNGSDGRTAADFSMIWGGDVTNLASGDNGRTFWVWWWGEGCNYVTSPEADFTISNFSPSWINKECPYWEAPIWVPSQNPDQCFTSGRPKGSTGSYLIRIQAQKNAAATAVQYPFNFKSAAGDLVTAIAISPVDSSYWYVATANGYFFRSVDAGKTWSTKKLLSGSLYARAIYPSRLVVGKVWIGGSGYSNPAVYYSADNGTTFKGLTTGLPKTIVEAFDANPDESLLFAATGVAPMMLRTATNEWIDIAGMKAPLVHYMDVEYLSGINTARFATYARGIWDFEVPKSVGIQTDKFTDSSVRFYPVPAHHELTIEIDLPDTFPTDIRLFSFDGKLVISQRTATSRTTLNVSGLERGIYLLEVNRNGNRQSGKIILQ
jgi:hypothetical protein